MYGIVKRTTEQPYIAGDLFTHENGTEVTLINHNIGTAVLNKDGFTAFLYAMPIDLLIKKGFTPDQEHIEESKRIAELGLFAPRKLLDDTWLALTPLYATTAICVDYDDISPFVSRYCFEDSNYFSRTENALLLASKFKTSLDRPIGNVAFRGHLGTKSVFDPIMTNDYYNTLHRLKYEISTAENVPSINDYARSYLDSIACEIINNGFDLLNDRQNKLSIYSDEYEYE